MTAHRHQHALGMFGALDREGLVLPGRRNFLKAGLAGIAGLSVADLLRHQTRAAQSGTPATTGKSVILLWLTGGPSQIDTWDPKPDRPENNRGPFKTIRSRLPGVALCEHLPKQAAMLDKFSLIRSVDARGSSHGPNRVVQAGTSEAHTRNPRGHLYPAIGSVVARYHGPNHPDMPGYAAFMTGRSHVATAGDLRMPFDPFDAYAASKLPIYSNVGADTGQVRAANLFNLADGLDRPRIQERRSLLQAFDNARRDVDQSGVMDAMDKFGQKAVQMVLGDRARAAFDLDREPAKTREHFGKHLWCQQALLARRLVEAGVAFVTIDLSYHTASGTWDTHGDKFPPYGGIESGLRPLLPLFDHLLTTLVRDLEERGLLRNVLVLAMGEFGRTPIMGTQGSPDGRNHWPEVMSVCLAGGGFRHGQVIGASDQQGGYVKDRPVTPGDLAATIYHHFGIPRGTTYIDSAQRPRAIVEHGEPLQELL